MSDNPISIRLTDVEKKMLENLATELGVSQASLMRLLIRLGAKFVDQTTIGLLREYLKVDMVKV